MEAIDQSCLHMDQEASLIRLAGAILFVTYIFQIQIDKKMKIMKLTLAVLLLVLMGCTSSAPESTKVSDPLPSWNEGKTKQAILDFVQDVTNPACDCFVAVPDRIAVFDNDGNLWSEQPAYFQLFFAIDRVKQMASENPQWKTQQPFQVHPGEMTWRHLPPSENTGSLKW